MTINTALEQLLEIEEKRKENVISKDTYCVGVARIGAEDQKIVFGKIGDLINVDFGLPLHSLVICAKLHTFEEEILQFYKK